jgi:hypothetical protein
LTGSGGIYLESEDAIITGNTVTSADYGVRAVVRNLGLLKALTVTENHFVDNRIAGIYLQNTKTPDTDHCRGDRDRRGRCFTATWLLPQADIVIGIPLAYAAASTAGLITAAAPAVPGAAASG